MIRAFFLCHLTQHGGIVNNYVQDINYGQGLEMTAAFAAFLFLVVLV